MSSSGTMQPADSRARLDSGSECPADAVIPAQSRESPKISILVLTRNRLDVLRDCVRSVISQRFSDYEILILDDASDDTDTAAAIAAEFSAAPIRAFRSEVPLGVAGGRNYLMLQAMGDLLVTIDDDAVFPQDDALENVCAAFESQPGVGIVAFRVTNVINGRRIPNVPFRRSTVKRHPDVVRQQSLTASYIGCGHAMRRSLIDKLGGYRPDMMFGGEEMDLAYRTIQAGYQIVYDPSIVVDHFPRPSVVRGGRSGGRSERYYVVRNRAYLAYRYLPLRYLVSYLAIWLTFDALRSSREGKLLDFIRGALAVPAYLRTVERNVLNRSAIAYMKRHHGRLWF